MECGFNEKEIISFRDSFWGSPVSTIDEYISLNPQFNRLAKFVISMALIPNENEVVFDGRNPTSSWYHSLFNVMLDGTHWENFSNDVYFVTFNYDRSLEYFFFRSLKNTYTKLGVDELYKIMQNLKIVHVHGKLGSLMWEGKTDLREYKSNINQDNLFKASSSIVTINESDENTPEYTQARELIGNSRKVIFLGFDFHDFNIQRLNATNCLNDKKILGTAMDISSRRMEEIVKIIPNSKIGLLPDINCSNFMNQNTHNLI
tara:strand:- start:143 stop:922 length:780 start_codon:yes stop_codon:yes gene_type:complete